MSLSSGTYFTLNEFVPTAPTDVVSGSTNSHPFFNWSLISANVWPSCAVRSFVNSGAIASAFATITFTGISLTIS